MILIVFFTIERNIQSIFSINHNELTVKLLPDKVIWIKLTTDILMIHVASKIELAKKFYPCKKSLENVIKIDLVEKSRNID